MMNLSSLISTYHLSFRVRQVPLAPGARLALQERMVHKGPQGALETQELWERK